VAALAMEPATFMEKDGRQTILTICSREGNEPPLSQICIQVWLPWSRTAITHLRAGEWQWWKRYILDMMVWCKLQ